MNKIIQLVKWNEPMHTSERIYHRGSIKLPNTQTIDIMLINDNPSDHLKIGEAQLIENEIGLYTHNVKYFINEKELNKTIKENVNEYKKLNPNVKYHNELTITCIGIDKTEFKEKNSVELKFLCRQLLINKDIKLIIRDLKLKSLI
jgi:hypothetical protein